MDYLDEQQLIISFYNLVGIQSDIYDLTVHKLLELEKEGIKDTSKYDKIIKEIEMLKLKENRIYEKLNASEYYYQSLEILDNIIKDISLGDEEKYEAISERLSFHFDVLFNEESIIIEMNENIYDYVDIDEDEEEEIVIIPEFQTLDFYTPVQIKFICELMKKDPKNKEYLKYKFYNSFIHPRLEEELFLARYNPNNIHDIDINLDAEASDITVDEYKKNMALARESFANTAFDNFVEDATDLETTPEKLELSYEQAQFGLSALETKKIAEFINKHFGSDEEYIISKEAVDYFDKLGNTLLDTIFSRDDYNENILNILNSDNVDLDFSEIKFDKTTYDDLFDMINISKEIYFIATDLYCLDLIGKKGSKEYLDKINILDDIVQKEKEYARQLYFIPEEKDAAKELIEKYLEFIYNLDGRGGIIDNNDINIQIITKRIQNLLWPGKILDLSTFKDENIPNEIIKNYQLECLSEYEKYINENERNDYLGFKYLEVISDHNLTDEFIFEKGYIENAIILDDEITSKILGIEVEEYVFDKEDLISNHATDIMTSLAMFSEDYELEGFDKAALDYQTVALEIAFKYANEDDLEALKANFESSPVIQNLILSKKLKTLFNKKEEKTLKLVKNDINL
ncbi:MAG: hypothetical protein IKE75_05190 [Bacilli bacterium]|nr:hypothetical protein [Bacilli bacterium]